MPPTEKRAIQLQKRAKNAFLTAVCSLWRYKQGSAPFADSGIWELVSTAVPCRVIQAGDSARAMAATIAAQQTIENLYQIVIPAGYQVAPDYRVKVEANTYEVIAIEDALTDSLYIQLVVTRNKGQGIG